MSSAARRPLLAVIASHVVTAAVTLLLVGVLYGDRGPWEADSDSGGATPIVPTDPATPPEPWEPTTTDEMVNVRVYEAANRGVVNISTSATIRGLFRDAEVSGSGSGFVIDKKGHILTNFHVIEDAVTSRGVVRVGLFDGTVLDAEIVGTDPNNDVAVLKIDAPAKQLFPLKLDEGSELKVGQKVLALGNPFGLERTLTTGVISSLDRSLEARNGRTIKGIIQTDAAINPGNSGGPLLNAEGEVIGMNTAIYSQVGQSAGISFAVPIDRIRRVLEPLIRQGYVVRASIGVNRVFALDEGLLIVDLEKGGPADRAGLRSVRVVIEQYGPYTRARLDPSSADMIVAIDGVPVRSISELLTEVESHQPGASIPVTILRQGRKMDVLVKLGRSDER